MKSQYKKKSQLGIDPGTATSRLKKMVMFDLLRQLEKNYCYQCGAEIETVEQLSLEHKVPWLHSKDPAALFFDLTNIAFSHLKCNVNAARKVRGIKHPSRLSYDRGCRCVDCKAAHAKVNREDRQKHKI